MGDTASRRPDETATQHIQRMMADPQVQQWAIYVCPDCGDIADAHGEPAICINVACDSPTIDLTEVVPASLLSESQAEVERLKKLLEDTAAAVMMAGARRDELSESLAAALKRADEKLAHIVHRIKAVQAETIGEALSSVSRPEGQ